MLYYKKYGPNHLLARVKKVGPNGHFDDPKNATSHPKNATFLSLAHQWA